MEVRSLEAIVGALNSAGVPYLISGALAVVAHGYMRCTDDSAGVDLLLRLSDENRPHTLEVLRVIDW